LLGASGVCAGLAASVATRHERALRAQVGSLVPVIVARRDLPAGVLITPDRARSQLIERRVPARFVPPSALHAARDAVGFKTQAPLAAGDYVGARQLGTSEVPGSAARFERPAAVPGAARVVEVAVAGAQSIEDSLVPGAFADVLVTSDEGAGPPRTYLALQRVQIAAFRPGAPSAGGRSGAADGTAALRVTLRQAVLLTAAQNFARELRLVPRQAGDERRLPPASISAQQLGG
jgi:pilus assembly protein CpaB